MDHDLNKLDSSPIILKSSRLAVEISKPGVIYHGSRFDWSAFITQVTLDGRHTFCVPENYTPEVGTGGIGLCNEFGIDMPVGYDDAEVGDYFPKIGIGLLTRDSAGPYAYSKPYNIIRFPICVSTAESSAEFIVEPIECRGYAMRLKKTVLLDCNFLKIDYVLENVGTKTISTSEYCHNFIGIDRHNIGKDYRLSLPYEIKLQSEDDVLTHDKNVISWNSTPASDFYGILDGHLGSEQFQWELFHNISGVGVREVSKLPVSKFALWGTTHVTSPEVFVDISLKPGEIKAWSREYEFF